MRSNIFWAITAAILFGLSTPFSKALLAETSPWLLAGILYFGSGLGIFLLSQIRRFLGQSISKEASLQRSDFAPLLLATLFGGGLGPVFLMLGLERTSASASSLLLNMEGVLTASIAWLVFKEHASRRIVIGMMLIVLGGLALTWTPGGEEETSHLGMFFVVMACLSWAIDNNVTRKISASDPLQITFIKSLVAGGVNLLLATLVGASWPSFKTVALGGLLGFTSYGLSLVCFVMSLRSIGTARTGAYFSTAPFVGACVSLVIFRESLSIQIVLALLLMAIGVYLHLTENHSHEHIHELLQHNHKHIHDEHHQHDHELDDPAGEPHTHLHVHKSLTHAHPHYPDIHHRHKH